MNDSILLTIRKMLGPGETYAFFDADIIVLINSALSTLTQIGIGPKEGFAITGEVENWSDFIGDDPRLNMVKTYVYLKTKIVFDPPLSGSVMESYKEEIKQYEWRLNVEADSPKT